MASEVMQKLQNQLKESKKRNAEYNAKKEKLSAIARSIGEKDRAEGKKDAQGWPAKSAEWRRAYDAFMVWNDKIVVENALQYKLETEMKKLAMEEKKGTRDIDGLKVAIKTGLAKIDTIKRKLQERGSPVLSRALAQVGREVAAAKKELASKMAKS